MDAKDRNYKIGLNDLIFDTFYSGFKTEEHYLRKHCDVALSINEIHVINKIGISGAKPMSEVAAALKITVSSLTVAIDKLVKKGFVSRLRSEEDRRIVFIALTPAGQEVYHAHGQYHEHLVDATLKDLSKKEVKMLVQAVMKLRGFFEEQGENL